MPEQLEFTVPYDCDKMTALNFLRRKCGVSSRMITRLKREKDGILMNGKILRTIDPVEGGARVIINLPSESSRITPVKGELDIIFEDEHLLAVNKPPFMPVHPVKQHQTDTLANIVAYHAEQRGESYVFRAHNRLDRDTSGLVLIAKDRFTINRLKNSVNKTYFAITHGKISEKGTVKAPIGLCGDSKMVRHVLPEGAVAITHYTPLFCCEELSLISLSLETGKTHQIRCHMAHLGHPLLGDDLYGGRRDRINRQALHCGIVRLTHPVTGEEIELKADIPEDMLNIINEYN